MNDNDPEYVDRPDVHDVLQEETGMVAVPVRIVDPVQVDQLPHELAAPRTIVCPIGKATPLAGRVPGRGRITIIVYNADVMIDIRPMSRPDQGAFVPSGIPVPLHLQARDALYAYPVSLDLTGTNVDFNDAADIALVSVFDERWAR